MYKGIFWVIDQKLLCIKAECDENGTCCDSSVVWSSKSGDNFNHRTEWHHLAHSVTHGKPFDYYPRGRVEIRNHQVMIFLNPALCTEVYQQLILNEFEITSVSSIPVRFIADGSRHYQYVDNTTEE